MKHIRFPVYFVSFYLLFYTIAPYIGIHDGYMYDDAEHIKSVSKID